MTAAPRRARDTQPPQALSLVEDGRAALAKRGRRPCRRSRQQAKLVLEVSKMSLQTQDRNATTPDQTTAGDPAYDKARERARTLQGLYVHLFVFAIVNAGLFLINWATRGPVGRGGRHPPGHHLPSGVLPRVGGTARGTHDWPAAWTPLTGPIEPHDQGGQDAGGSGRPGGIKSSGLQAGVAGQPQGRGHHRDHRGAFHPSHGCSDYWLLLRHLDLGGTRCSHCPNGCC